MKSLDLHHRLCLVSGVLIAVTLVQIHVNANPFPYPNERLGEKTDDLAALDKIESDEAVGTGADVDSDLLNPQLDAIPNPAAVQAAEAALLQLDQDIHGETDAAGEVEEVVRDKRTIRFLTRIYCMFFRSSSTCVQPEPASSSTSSDNDDFWLNYLNSNGTDTSTTTTARPTIWSRKRAFLSSLFPNLFPERRGGGGGGGFLSGLLGGGGGSGGGGGGFLTNILAIPMRLFRSFSGASGGGGGGYSNSF